MNFANVTEIYWTLGAQPRYYGITIYTISRLGQTSSIYLKLLLAWEHTQGRFDPQWLTIKKANA